MEYESFYTIVRSHLNYKKLLLMLVMIMKQNFWWMQFVEKNKKEGTLVRAPYHQGRPLRAYCCFLTLSFQTKLRTFRENHKVVRTTSVEQLFSRASNDLTSSKTNWAMTMNEAPHGLAST